MAIKLKIKNPSVNQEERTYLSTDYASGVTVYLANNNGFTANWFGIFGEPGAEQTEIGRISSTTGVNILTLNSTLNFSHIANTVVYLTQWDKVSVERSTSENGTYAEISSSPFSIEVDNKDLATYILDSSGSTSHYYRWRFYNSVTATYSAYSDILSGTGIPVNVIGYVAKLVKMNPIAREVDDESILLYCHDFDELVYEEMPKAQWFTKEGTAVSTVADTYKYAIDSNWSDYVTMRYCLFTKVNGSITETYPLGYIPLLEFYNFKQSSTTASSDSVSGYTILPGDSSSLKGYIGLNPTPDTANCYVKPVYEKEPEVYNSFGDKLLIPKAKGYVDYVLYRIYDDIVRDTTNADKYGARVTASIKGLKVRARKQMGEYKMFNYRGQKGMNSMFGGLQYINPDDRRENYF